MDIIDSLSCTANADKLKKKAGGSPLTSAKPHPTDIVQCFMAYSVSNRAINSPSSTIDSDG